MSNDGTAEHDFAIGTLADAFSDKPSSSARMHAGETANVTYTFTGVGPFAFASHAERDFLSGQVGYIVVGGPDVAGVGTDAEPRLVALRVDASGFNRPSLTMTKGETVTFLISNNATDSQEFIVGPADKVAAGAIDQITVVTTGPIAAGQVKTLTYSFPAAGGTYAFTDGSGAKGTITFR